MSDDVLPLKFPIIGKNGEEINSIRVKEGQASRLVALLLLAPAHRVIRLSASTLSQSTATRPSGDPMPTNIDLNDGWTPIHFLRRPSCHQGYMA